MLHEGHYGARVSYGAMNLQDRDDIVVVAPMEILRFLLVE